MVTIKQRREIRDWVHSNGINDPSLHLRIRIAVDYAGQHGKAAALTRWSGNHPTHLRIRDYLKHHWLTIH